MLQGRDHPHSQKDLLAPVHVTKQKSTDWMFTTVKTEDFEELVFIFAEIFRALLKNE